MVWTAHKAKPYAPASGTATCDLVRRTGPGGFAHCLVRMKSARAASLRPSAVKVTVGVPGTIAQEHRDTVEVDSDPSMQGGDRPAFEKNILPLAEGQRK